MHYNFFCNWSKSQIDIMFILTSNTINADVILEERQGRELIHVLADIHECKSTTKPDRDERQRYVADHAARLEQMWRATSSVSRKRAHVEIGDDCIPDLRKLAVAPSAMVCKYVDIGDNKIKEFSVRDWIKKSTCSWPWPWRRALRSCTSWMGKTRRVSTRSVRHFISTFSYML